LGRFRSLHPQPGTAAAWRAIVQEAETLRSAEAFSSASPWVSFPMDRRNGRAGRELRGASAGSRVEATNPFGLYIGSGESGKRRVSQSALF
jgi:hypothetical protein